MEIILLRDVENLGLEGEIKKVKPGYARNFLLPKKHAIQATAGNIKSLKRKLEKLEEQRNKRIASAEEKKKMLEDLNIKLEASVGQKGRLFGSITNTNILDQLVKAGFETIDKRHIKVPHVKEIGTYTAQVKLLEGINAHIPFSVIPDSKSKVETKKEKPVKEEEENKAE